MDDARRFDKSFSRNSAPRRWPRRIDRFRIEILAQEAEIRYARLDDADRAGDLTEAALSNGRNMVKVREIQRVLGEALPHAESANAELVEQIKLFNEMWRAFEAAKLEVPSARTTTVQYVYKSF